ncbi:hypothetical protein AB0K05_15665 [Nonomuraea sp. NPDC049486]|uniref:hypothetical protein n=1 Tax=Nonomuraea sp. NPDC049486 TaxID=3155773 RepID=UPI00342BCD38
MLLILGGLLLTVAAVVFTVVSWGWLGIGGRAVVLAGFTALVMVAPVVLMRRGLTATAETVAGFAVALLLLDGYAARQAGFLGADALDASHYTAGVLGGTALILVAYARVTRLTGSGPRSGVAYARVTRLTGSGPRSGVAYARVTRLRGPGPVAVVLAQPVLTLLAGSLPGTWLVAALVATAALDAALVRHVRGAVRVTAALAGSGVAALALLGGTTYALGAPSVGQALVRVGPLVALALLGGFVIWLLARQGDVEGETWAAVVTAGTALTLIAVVAAPAQAALAGPGAGWRSLAYLVPALAVVLAATWLPWRRVRLAGMATGGLVALLVTLTLLPRLVVTLGSPLPWLDVFWTGTWGGPQWQPFATASPADVVVLGTVAAALLVAAVWGAGGRPVMEVLPGTAGRAVPRGESESESEGKGEGEGEGEGEGKGKSEARARAKARVRAGASGRCGWRRAGRWWSGRSWSPSRPRPSRCPTRPWWRSRWRWPSRWRSPPRWAGRRGGPGRARSSPGRPRRGRRRTRSAASRRR